MIDKRKDLSERLLDYAASVIKLAVKLGRTPAGRHISGQLTRSSTSAGANYEEACGAESRADFIHKMQVVLKELNESSYWLKLIMEAELLAHDSVQPILAEGSELTKIIAKSIVTAKSNR